MKIHLSNVDFRSQSGPNSFAGRLAKRLMIDGYEIVDHNNEYDCMLAFIEPRTNPRPGSRLIQRLDGIWFKPEEFEPKNRSIKKFYEKSDHVIFQSNFDKEMVEHHWGPANQSSVIHNGINLEKVDITNSQIREIRNRFERIFVSSASWHRQKRLKENTELFLKIAGSDEKSCFIVMGRNPDHVVSHPRIFYTGEIDHNACLQIYAASDWMIHLAWLDHCPNVVVEAISQGCPVICTDSGGTSEIVRGNGVIIPEIENYKFELLDYDNPFHLEANIIDLPKIEIQNEYLDIKRVAEDYKSVIFGIS